ncbi:glycosyltransferase [uncultured Campylobacter sp.]|uniref:glycosyltransferase n=1 Tax=uncultured Campylobacter sp. TaxID=218934 RepID=UPI00260FEDD0|nr:glycosyltransferase [uncultured Campylobacter sp.]
MSNELNQPLVSVIMPCYNRERYISEAIESILDQTYTNFEFIILDNCSTDNTYEIAKEYAKKDKRIIVLQNEENRGFVYSHNKLLSLAKGKYIALMHDDDISLPQRFEKQVRYMEDNPDITVLGTLIESFPVKGSDWVIPANADLMSLLLQFHNPIAQSTNMIRTEFVKNNNIKFLEDYYYVVDYKFYMQILECGGKITNLDEVLLLYRFDNHSCSSKPETQKKQNLNARTVKIENLQRFLNEEEIKDILKKMDSYALHRDSIKSKELYELLLLMKERDNSNIISKKAYDEAIELYVGQKTTMHIFFTINDNYTQHLCVLIASILKNSTTLDDFHFYVLHDGCLSKFSKNNIKSLRNIKEFYIDFVEVNDDRVYDCEQSSNPEMFHTSKEVYFRYILPNINENINRLLYLDVDCIVEDSLNKFYNSDFKGKYIGVVDDGNYNSYEYYKKSFGVEHPFNAGVLLINAKKWREKRVIDKLFFNTKIFTLSKKIMYQDQDVLNYTLKNKLIRLNPKFNVQFSTLTNNTNETSYNHIDLHFANLNPAIIHYTGVGKPWDERGVYNPLWKRYWHYIKYTPYSFLLESRYKELFAKSLVNLYGAADRTKKHLSYRLGEVLLKTRSLSSAFSLFSRLRKAVKAYKSDKVAYNIMVKIYPDLKLTKLENYSDYQESLKVKKQLTYKLGELLIKHPFTFLFRVSKVYKEWKKEKTNEFK